MRNPGGTAPVAADAADAGKLRAATRWWAAGASRTGSKRRANEDSWLALPAAGPRPPLIAVADGVGGEAAGEAASAAAVEALQRAWRSWGPAAEVTAGEAAARLLDAAREADAAVRAVSSAGAASAGAATTLTAAVPAGAYLNIVHAGDSRAYVIHDGAREDEPAAGAVQVTRDHSWVEVEVAAGRLSPEAASRHPQRNVITRYLGQDGGCEFDVSSEPLAPSDVVVLCSDGVSNELAPDDLALASARDVEPENAARRLIAEVAARSGPDDATVVVLACDRGTGSDAPVTLAPIPADCPAATPNALANGHAVGASAHANQTDIFDLRRSAPRPQSGVRLPRRTLVVGAAGLAVLAGAGAAAWRARSFLSGLNKPSPDLTAGDYIAQWRERRYDGMYALLSSDARERINQDAFIRRYEAIAAELTLTGLDAQLAATAESAGRLQLGLTDALDFPATVTYHTARFGDIARQVTLPLLWQDGRWAIDWSPATILPELTGGRLVRALSDTAVRGAILARDGRPLASSAAGAAPPAPGASSAAAGRQYPQGTLAGPLTGYVGEVTADEVQSLGTQGLVAGDSVGRAGIEAAAESLLAGTRGGRLTVIEPNGDVAAELASVPPRQGQTVTLSLDLDLQRDAEAILGRRLGSIVLADPRSGAIRALASSPSYDPNVFTAPAAAAPGAPTAAAVLNDPQKALLVRPLQGQYPPGSTFKVVTMAAALESGAFSPSSEFTCTGSWSGVPGLTFRCWLPTGHGTLNLVQGLTHSCDVVFYEVGKRLHELDPHLLPAMAARCGAGSPSGVAPGIEPAGIAPGPDWKRRTLNDAWVTADSVNMAIGQGQLLMTPVQLAAIYGVIATRGAGPGLRLMERAALAGGSVEQPLPAASLRAGWQPETYDAIRVGLSSVVGSTEGTAAFVFAGSPLASMVSGKTGTAETGDGRATHAWFACYAPSDAPRALVVVMLEHGGEGSTDAAPLARRLLEATLDRM